MARRLLGVTCVAVSVGCLWLVDPETRTAAMTVKAAAWGLAGVAVVALVRSAVHRLTGRRWP
jgi:hypothetical protein